MIMMNGLITVSLPSSKCAIEYVKVYVYTVYIQQGVDQAGSRHTLPCVPQWATPHCIYCIPYLTHTAHPCPHCHVISLSLPPPPHLHATDVT